jgi:hypothetical protein
MSTTRLSTERDSQALRELSYRSRQAFVATKQALGLSARADKTFFVDKFSRELRSPATRRTCGITTLGRTDGAGAQAQSLMSAIAFAHAHGLQYVHRPFATIEHAEMEMPAWVRLWEEYFNLGDGESSLADDARPLVSLDYLHQVPRHVPVVAAAEHYLHYCNQDPEAWERVRPLLRAKYWKNKSPGRHPRVPDELRIAIHMRRGDVSAGNKKVANNFTPNATFVNTLQRLRSLIGERAQTLRIDLLSQGTPDMFADMSALGATLRLNEPAVETHRAMVEADILVMSKGAFSYTAALLNDGIVLYDPQKYRALQDWGVRTPDGSFDEAEVSARLARIFTRG